MLNQVLRAESKKRYEDRRVLKNISFNAVADANILTAIEKHHFVFSVWVKHVLNSFTPGELVVLDNDINAIPSVLIERAIESGMFDLDEYLAAQGKKIVDIKSQSGVQDIDFYQIDQSPEQYEFEAGAY